jgi:hypothetical protein
MASRSLTEGGFVHFYPPILPKIGGSEMLFCAKLAGMSPCVSMHSKYRGIVSSDYAVLLAVLIEIDREHISIASSCNRKN